MDAPVIGADGPAGGAPQSWLVSFSWRYQKSFRHFVGDEEQHEREEEESQVINRVNLADIGIRYNVSSRWSVSASIPYLMASRSSPIRDANDVVIGRSISRGAGLGDITLVARRWMLDPAASSARNLSLGFGVKLPTGESGQVGTRIRMIDGELVTSVETVDQSIQPGDGGFGFLVDLATYQRLFGDRAAIYASGTYLSNPQGTNGIQTFRSRASESTMSIADQYVARIGANTIVPGLEHASFSLGFRAEGVPAEDLFGPSNGFRRPGYAYSIEPSLSYRFGTTTLSAAVPVAIHRNRTISVPDQARGGHGDAAFADWVLLVGASRTL